MIKSTNTNQLDSQFLGLLQGNQPPTTTNYAPSPQSRQATARKAGAKSYPLEPPNSGHNPCGVVGRWRKVCPWLGNQLVKWRLNG